MKVYSYDDNKIYVGEREANLDPLETKKQGKDIYLLPANCTFEKPKTIKGKVAVFEENKWNYYEDNRGKSYYDNGIQEVKKINDKHIILTDEEKELIYQGMTCELVDGKYKIYFTDKQLKEKIISTANSYLNQYDFYFNSDYPTEKIPARMTEYRAYLRALNSEKNLQDKDIKNIIVKTYKEFIAG